MTAARKIRVLAVDDNRAIHTSLAASFDGSGLELTTVVSSEEAVQKLAGESFDVLVSDIWLPESGGIQLIKLVRKQYPAMKVYAMTGGGPGMSTESAASLAIMWGADRVFLKPFDEVMLIEDIRATINLA